MSLGQVGKMQKSNVLVVGIVVIVAILAFVLLRGRGEEIVQKVDDFEPPSIYNTNPTPSPFEVAGNGFVTSPTPVPTLRPTTSPSPSPLALTKGGVTPSASPSATHAPVDTAIGDINPSLLVMLTGGLAYLALKASRLLSVNK